MFPSTALVLLIGLAVFAGVGCNDDGGRETKPRGAKPRERAKVGSFLIYNRRPQGGILAARAQKGDLLDLRIFVVGPAGRAGSSIDGRP